MIHRSDPVNVKDAPRISASVTNTGVKTFTAPKFVATVFDTDGNAFAASETYVDYLHAGESHTIDFVWPEPFLSTIGRVDIIAITTPQVRGQ